MTDRMLLIGMMGAGKSTVGAALAAHLGWAYLDSDAEIVRRRGMTVPEIWRAEGEPAFRAEESAVLAAAAVSSEAVVVGVAGGALLDPANRALVRGAGSVVWLRAAVTTLAERVGAGEGRPLLDGGAATALARLYVEREPIYAAMADVVVDVEGRSPEKIVELVVAALSRRAADA